MAFQTKNSVMAIMEETTEGTPVIPSAATDYIGVREGFDVNTEFDTLENDELTGSIGRSAPIQGFENPNASLPFYLRPSGTEGVAPEFNLLYKAAFGAEVVASTEYDTVAGSTVSIVNVDTGEGVNFQRGQALLVKDATNNYSIRNVLSVSGDALTLGQNLANAPASGVNLGKAVLYKPESSGHPTLTLWDYRANQAVVQAITGTRVTEISMSAVAGEILEGSFSLEGLKAFFNPTNVTSSTKYIDFVDDSGTYAAILTEKLYRDPEELRAEVESKMNAVASDTITVTYDYATGKFTLASDGSTTFSLLWLTGTNNANGAYAQLGFDKVDETGALTYTSDNAQDLTSPYTPSLDSLRTLVGKNNEIIIGDSDDITCFPAQSIEVTFSNEKTNDDTLCAETGRRGSIFTGREISIDIVATLEQYDADKFIKMRENTDALFAYNFGTKSSGNWVAGSSGNIFTPKAKITAHKVGDNNGLVTMEISVQPYVQNGLGEFYLNFL
jgi:hypothetical protein